MFYKGLGEKITRGIVGDPTAFGFYSGFEGSAVYSTALQPDGKIIVSGDFDSYNGTSVENVVRLNSDLTLDTSFNPTGAGIDPSDTSKKKWADKIYVFSNGRIALVYSQFAYDAGTSPPALLPGFVILDSTGAVDTTDATFKNVESEISQNVTKCAASDFKNDELVVAFEAGIKVAHFNSNGTIKRTYDSIDPLYSIAAEIRDIALDGNDKLWAVGKLTATDPTNNNNISQVGGIWTWDSNGDRDLTTFKGAFSLYGQGITFPTEIEIDASNNLWVATNKPYYESFFNGDKLTNVNHMVYKLGQDGTILDHLAFDQYSYPRGIFRGDFKLFDNNYLAMGSNAQSSEILRDSANSNYYHKMLIVNPDGSFNTNFASATTHNNSGDRTWNTGAKIWTITKINSTDFIVGGTFTEYDGVNRNLFMVMDISGNVLTPPTY
jgi:hypothetical protein